MREQKGITGSNAFDRATVLHVLGKEDAAASAAGGSDQQGIEELKTVLLVPSHGDG